jgi:type IV pilus assembly protein PilW
VKTTFRITRKNFDAYTFKNAGMMGISLVEIMVGLTLGVILSIAIIGVYIAQKNTYKTNASQASIQNAENAISALVSPTIRAAGFCGCATLLQGLSHLNGGGAPPLGTLGNNLSMVMGYDAASGNALTITNNASNSNTATDWTAGLDASLLGNIVATSDVLIVLGGTPGSQPISVTAMDEGSVSLTLQNTTGVAAGQFGAVSDCLKASIFQITGVTGNTISHAAGGGVLDNASDVLTVNYAPGSQFVSLTQTAFFVAQNSSGQSALMRATLNTDGTWTIQSLAPGVDTMQVRYGIGSNGIPSQYVPASAVTNWGQVYAVRLGFLLEGQQGSGTKTATQFSVLGTTVNVPADNRLRHVYEMTINLRNAT